MQNWIIVSEQKKKKFEKWNKRCQFRLEYIQILLILGRGEEVACEKEEMG